MTELLGVGRGDGPLDRDQKRGTGSGQYRHAFGGGTRRQRLVLPCAQIVAVQDAAADKRHTAERIDRRADHPQRVRLAPLQRSGFVQKKTIAHHFDPILSIEIDRSEEHTSELQSLMRISYAVFCLKKNKQKTSN